MCFSDVADSICLGFAGEMGHGGVERRRAAAAAAFAPSLGGGTGRFFNRFSSFSVMSHPTPRAVSQLFPALYRCQATVFSV